MRKRRQCSGRLVTTQVLGLILALLVAAFGHQLARAEQEPYIPDPDMEAPTITSPDDEEEKVVCVGGEMGFVCSEVTDYDTCWNNAAIQDLDSVTHWWQDDGGGSFPNGNIGTSVDWEAPSDAGDVDVTAYCDDDYGDDDHLPGGDDLWQKSDPVTIAVVEVESISGLGTVYCTHADCSEGLTAELTDSKPLPSGCSVTWGGDADFENASGLTVTAKFANHQGKNKKITAKVGAQDPACESAAFAVVENTSVTGVTVVTYNEVWADPGALYGVTQRGPIVVDITAYFAHPDHKWHCKVTTSTSEIQCGWHLIAGVSEPSVAACTSQDIYRKMVADLQAYGEGAGVQWYMVDAVEAHERVHIDDWKNGNNPCFDTFRSTVEALTADYADGTCETAAQARTVIMASTAYTDAHTKYITDGTAAWNDPATCHPGCDARTEAAEAGETAGMIADLDTHAAAQTPPWTR